MALTLAQWINKERVGDKHVCLQSTPIRCILEKRAFHRVAPSHKYIHRDMRSISLFLYLSILTIWIVCSRGIRNFGYALKIVQHTQIGPTTIIMNLQFRCEHFIVSAQHSIAVFFHWLKIYLKRVTNIDCILMKARIETKQNKNTRANQFRWETVSVTNRTALNLAHRNTRLSVYTCWIRYSIEIQWFFLYIL